MATPRQRLGASLLALALAGSGVLATTLAAPAPARAEVRTFPDDRNGETQRIKRVKVDHGLFSLRLRIKAYDLSHGYDLYLDTAPSRPGPEYVVQTSLETEGFSVHDFRGWGRPNAAPPAGPQRCEGRLAWSPRRQSAWLSIPRPCLRTDPAATAQPRKVRINVVSWDEVGRPDHLPAPRAFTGWVRRGPR